MSQIYRRVGVSILCYGASVWQHRASGSHVIRALQAGQRPFLLSISRACRTTSNDALQVLSRAMPADLEIARGAVRY